MNIKQMWTNLSETKKSMYYWAGIIALIDLVVATQRAFQFSQTGECRNYMGIGDLHACSTAEFLKYGLQWVSFTNVFMFIPAAAVMILTGMTLREVFAKKED